MNRRILVVDDDAAIRQTFELQIGRLGYDVRVAGSAEDALSRINELDPDVVVSDIRMPGLGGLALLAHLHAVRPALPVVMITAHQDMPSAVAAMKAGAYDYLVKPLDLDHIETLLDRLFRDRDATRRAGGIALEPQTDDGSFASDRLIGVDAQMIEIYKTIGTVASNRAPVLVRGETGTGKELIARAIHFHSDSAAEPFVAINCTALPETLLESELFGHVRGAFTGATGDRKGRFEVAARGTIFLDEIGDTTPTFQAKLLRVLQNREFYPVGGERPKTTEARVIAATHRPLEQLVAEGRFREDLYFRLRVVEIVLPPLRDRPNDIGVLARHFVANAARAAHRASPALSREALGRLEEYSWPGNVRELENAVTRAVALVRGDVISAELLSLGTSSSEMARTSTRGDDSLSGAERTHIAQVLEKTNGNKRRAATLLGVSRSRLDRLMEKHGLAPTE